MNAIIDMSPVEERFRAEVREFACQEIEPVAAENDELGRFPAETFKRMGELGHWMRL